MPLECSFKLKISVVCYLNISIVFISYWYFVSHNDSKGISIQVYIAVMLLSLENRVHTSVLQLTSHFDVVEFDLLDKFLCS